MLSLKFLYDSPIISKILGWKRRTSEVMPAEEDPGLEEDPLRQAYVRIIPQAQLFRGILLQGYLVPPDVLCGLENMEIREDDVFVITYPKSGTTWTEEILSLIYNDGDVSKVEKELLIYRVHHLEVGRPFGQLRFLRNLRSPRLMATHLPFPLIPKMLRQARCKVIYVVRNPKDTAVSYYHHHKMSTFLGNYSGTWDEFLAHFMAGHLVYGSWFDHVLQYWKFCRDHPDKVFFVSYEEMKMDLKHMVGLLAEFLQRDISESTLEVISKHCSFEEMKTNRMVNREKLPISDMFDMTKSKFMRKGIIGDWKNYFSADQSKVFDEYYRKKMQGSDLELVFEPDEAMTRMADYGRIICNHPENHPSNEESIGSDSSESSTEKSSDDSEQYTDVYSHVSPPMMVHLQPDPLLVDFLN